jgi:alpha-mannosidase
MPRRVAIVPHTHWDREWYEPYQSFRLRLVDLLDDLVPRLESDLSYARFLLDGQMAMVDDYLEVRPEAAASIRRLVTSGRMSMGPWYVLMDEFLVSGETIVRDMQMGLQRASWLGGAMSIGYLPDMFGHIAQMPQILRLAGMDHAVVWRGVPRSVDRTAFWWSSPDGSKVRAEYLVCGYGNGASIPPDAKSLVRRLSAHEEEIGEFLLDGILFMNGTDHQRPQPFLGRVVAEANQIQDDFELVVTSLAEELPRLPTEGLPAWTGELRSGARANLLMGVASNRVDVKQAAARAERAVEKMAEPLSALFLPPERWPSALLAIAWRELVRNAAHDSVCACSLDEVVDAVLTRYAEARHIGEGLAARAVDALGAQMREAGPVVVNPSQRARGGLVEVVLTGDTVPEGTQLLRRSPAPTDVTLRADEARSLLGAIREQQIGPHMFINRLDVADDADAISIFIGAAPTPSAGLNVDEARRDLYTLLGARPDTTIRLHFEEEPSSRVLARVEQVPRFGWSRLVPTALDHPVLTGEGARRGPSLGNGLVTAEVDPVEGTLSIDGQSGFDRLVDGGDYGDTYNYSPPGQDSEVSSPDRVELELVERGPVRGRVRVARTFSWPEAVDRRARSRTGRCVVTVTSIVELRAGEPYVRVHSTYDNPSRDHRLRAVFPLPHRAVSSRAECAFCTVERGLEGEGGPNERGLPTFPSRRFVQAGGLTIVHEGLLEYELVEIEPGSDNVPMASALALTLLRATGMLSRSEMSYRPLPAGPAIPLEGPQLRKTMEARYALCVKAVDPYAMADDVLVPLQVTSAPGGGHRGASGSELEVDGAEVSSVTRAEGGSLEVRVFNAAAEATTVRFPGRAGFLVDLRGRPQASFEGELRLGPWSIATVRLR